MSQEHQRPSVHSQVADTMAALLSGMITLRLVDRLEFVPLVLNAAAGTALASSVKYFTGKDDWVDVLVQCGLIYANYDGGPAAAAALTVWSAPIAYISKVFGQAVVSAGMKEAH